MKLFQPLSQELSLAIFLESEFGTMYFRPNVPLKDKITVRYLDGKLTIEMLSVYIQLYNSILQWIENSHDLKKYIFMPEILETGKDYLSRPFYVYHISTMDYIDKDEPVEPPKEYEEMIRIATIELSSASGKEETIRRVLRKSLLEPSGKTYFEDEMNKFVIVEPKISLNDLQEWQHLSS